MPLKKNKKIKKQFIVIASAVNQNPIQKSNLMYLSKEATDKDQNHKMKTNLSLDNEDPANNSEKIWNSNGFFGTKKGILLSKKLISLKRHWSIVTREQFQLLKREIMQFIWIM